MTDLIVGIASGYNWTELEPFVVSLRKSGYAGRCVLILGNGPHDVAPVISAQSNKDLREKLSEYAIEISDIGDFTEHPILVRFPQIANIINNSSDLRFVIACDTKDIVFQYNPMIWLENRLKDKSLCAVAEGATYEESWGNRHNALVAFGEAVRDNLLKLAVLNAGVIAGTPAHVARLCLDIYALSKQDLRLKTFTPGYQDMLPDQTAFNILLRNDALKNDVLIATASDGFVCEGNHFPQTRIADSAVYPIQSQTPFALVHQYFCHQEWIDLVNQSYREGPIRVGQR